MFHKSILLAVPMAVLLSGTSALALTADQVWADLQALAVENGTEIKAATEVKGDGTLTLNGVSIGPAGKPAALTIAEVSVEEQDDGSVAFFPTDIAVGAFEGGTASIESTELSVTVFEDEGGLGYSVFADMLKVVFDGTEGAAGAEERNAGTVQMEGLEATYGRLADAVTLNFVTKRLAYDLTQVVPSLSIDSSSTSDTADLTIEGTIAVPEGVTMASLEAEGAFEAAVNNGLAVDMVMSSGASTGTFADRNPALPLSGTVESAGGTASVVANKTEVKIETTAPGLKIGILPPGMPAPLPVSIDTMGFVYQMPVAAPEGGPFTFKLDLTNLVLDEAIWAMFDPSAALPREPANVALDLGGTAKIDLLAMSTAEATGAGEPPMPEPVNLDIRSLAINLAGAALSGTGAFTFDNSMLAAGGPPMPIGTANLRLEGGNKLIDGLIATGLLKEEDAMGARMMMAMFGKAEGEDVLTSAIEAKAGGSIFVNGQQIQ